MRFIGLLFLLPSLCFAGDWSREDSYWQMGYTALLAVDCAQTRWVASHPGKFEETDPTLGRTPSKGRIHNVCLGMGLGNFAISYALPKEYRRLWQLTTISVEAYIIKNNVGLGVKMEF